MTDHKTYKERVARNERLMGRGIGLLIIAGLIVALGAPVMHELVSRDAALYTAYVAGVIAAAGMLTAGYAVVTNPPHRAQ